MQIRFDLYRPILQEIIPYCIAAMGAETVLVPSVYEHGVTDISEVDAVVFPDNAVPDAMFNARKTATVEWVKQCLVSPIELTNLSRSPQILTGCLDRLWVCSSLQRYTVKERSETVYCAVL